MTVRIEFVREVWDGCTKCVSKMQEAFDVLETHGYVSDKKKVWKEVSTFKERTERKRLKDVRGKTREDLRSEKLRRGVLQRSHLLAPDSFYKNRKPLFVKGKGLRV